MFLPTLIAKQKPGEVGPDNLVLNASYLTVPSQKKATKKNYLSIITSFHSLWVLYISVII